MNFAVYNDDGIEQEIHVDPHGVRRSLNLRPSPRGFMASKPRGQILPRSAITAFDRWPSEVEIKDQGQYGACNGHAAATGAEATRVSAGMFHVPLSAWSIYAALCQGRDIGSSIAAALALISSVGIAPQSTVKWGTINPNLLSQAAIEASARFRIEVGYAVDTWDEILSAVALGQFANISIRVGNAFSNLDPEDVPAVSRGQANHAVCVGGGIKFSSKWGMMVRMANSWSTQWGDEGFCWLAEAHRAAATYFEGYTLDRVQDDPSDISNLPFV